MATQATRRRKKFFCSGLKNVGEIELLAPTRHGERRAPLFRISAAGASNMSSMLRAAVQGHRR
jgi:uncharacterized metal-binding protein